jgi:hypothetical protein
LGIIVSNKARHQECLGSAHLETHLEQRGQQA